MSGSVVSDIQTQATFLFLPHYDVIPCIYNWPDNGKMLIYLSSSYFSRWKGMVSNIFKIANISRPTLIFVWPGQKSLGKPSCKLAFQLTTILRPVSTQDNFPQGKNGREGFFCNQVTRANKLMSWWQTETFQSIPIRRKIILSGNRPLRSSSHDQGFKPEWRDTWTKLMNIRGQYLILQYSFSIL